MKKNSVKRKRGVVVFEIFFTLVAAKGLQGNKKATAFPDAQPVLIPLVCTASN